jgi:hypothetical protein
MQIRRLAAASAAAAAGLLMLASPAFASPASHGSNFSQLHEADQAGLPNGHHHWYHGQWGVHHHLHACEMGASAAAKPGMGVQTSIESACADSDHEGNGDVGVLDHR